MSVTFKLSEDRKMNCIFEKHKFQVKLISFWFISKKTINTYENISLEL